MGIFYALLLFSVTANVLCNKEIVDRQDPNNLMHLLLNDLDLISSEVAELVIRSTSDDKKNPKMMLDVSFSVKVKSRRSYVINELDDPISSFLQSDDIHEDVNRMIERKLAQAEKTLVDSSSSSTDKAQAPQSDHLSHMINESTPNISQIENRITFKCCYAGNCEITNIC